MLKQRNWIARFIYDKKHLHKNADGTFSIKKNAFQPKITKPETSVNLHRFFKIDIPWTIARRARIGETLIGVGELERSQLSVPLCVKWSPAWRKFNIFHANILGWDTNKAQMILQAQELASKAVFVPNDEEPLSDEIPQTTLQPHQFARAIGFLKGLVGRS